MHFDSKLILFIFFVPRQLSPASPPLTGVNMFKLRYLAIASAVAATLTASAIAQAAPVLEPATQHFIDALAAKKGPPIYTLSPADARNVLAGAQAQPVEKQAAQIEDRVIEAGPTGKIAIRT